MVGEGIKRGLLLEGSSLIQLEKNNNVIAALYKKQNDYIKIKWKILNDLMIDKHSCNTDLLFREEEKGNIFFISAEYVNHLCNPLLQLEKEDYHKQEYSVHCPITITDDFLRKQTNIGLNIIRFEEYLRKKQ